MSAIDDVLNCFRDIKREHQHAPRRYRHGDEEWNAMQRDYRLAQLELYNLAQAITFFLDPVTQDSLDGTRRRIMYELKKQLDLRETGTFPGSIIRVVRKSRPSRWEDFALTPELTFSPDVTGLAVPAGLVSDLRRYHKAQIGVVNDATR